MITSNIWENQECSKKPTRLGDAASPSDIKQLVDKVSQTSGCAPAMNQEIQQMQQSATNQESRTYPLVI